MFVFGQWTSASASHKYCSQPLRWRTRLASWIKRNVCCWCCWWWCWYENKAYPSMESILSVDEFLSRRLIMTWAHGTLTSIGIFGLQLCLDESMRAIERVSPIRIEVIHTHHTRYHFAYSTILHMKSKNDAQHGSDRRERNYYIWNLFEIWKHGEPCGGTTHYLLLCTEGKKLVLNILNILNLFEICNVFVVWARAWASKWRVCVRVCLI